MINGDVFVTPDEVFEVFIGFDDELGIDNNEHLHLIESSGFDKWQIIFTSGSFPVFILVFHGLFVHLVLLFLNSVIKSSWNYITNLVSNKS